MTRQPPVVKRHARSEHHTEKNRHVPRLVAGSLLGVAGLVLASSGCGTNLEQLLFESGASVERSLLDTFLTDFANTLAGPNTPPAAGEPTGTEPSEGEEGQEGAGGGTGTDFSALTGDPAAGETLFTANGCNGCHCDDAVGDCFPGAPAVIGVQPSVIDEHLRGDEPHPLKFDLSDQDVVDLAAFLASLP